MGTTEAPTQLALLSPFAGASTGMPQAQGPAPKTQQQGWLSTTEAEIGVRASLSIASLPENYEPCKTQADMVHILSNATFSKCAADATRVAEFIKSTKQPQAMVSVTCRTMLNRALLDSNFASWSRIMLHDIFRQVTEDENPALGSKSVLPKKFRYSTTEVVRKSMNARGNSKDGLENYLRFTLGVARLLKKKFMLRVLDLAAENVDNDQVVVILLGFMKNGGGDWMSRLGASRRHKSINESFQRVYARMTAEESIDPSTKKMLEDILHSKGEASKSWPAKKHTKKSARPPARK